MRSEHEETGGSPAGGCPAGVEEVALRAMRRRDRAVSESAAVAAMLDRFAVGVLATSGAERPHLNPNLFVFDSEASRLYLHTAGTGRTRSAVAANPSVAFCAYELGRLLPAETALAFSAEYRSVLLVGRASVVEDRDEARRALRALLRRYAPHLRPGRDYRDVTDGELARTTVVRVDVESWSGKVSTAEERDDGYRWSAAPAGPAR